jgi:hypothetical protein
MRFGVSSIVICAAVIGCSSAPRTNGETTVPESEARAFYQQYESALKLHRRDTLAHFYHPAGALIVFNGTRSQVTNAGLDSRYRGQWTGPVFFAFDSLQFLPLRAQQVLVTGRFRWLGQQSPDTGHFAYLSILDRTSAGLKISVEHETQLSIPRRP